jgi:hypothetical protein
MPSCQTLKCIHTQNSALGAALGSQQACGALYPLTSGDHRMRRGTHPMPHGDLLAVLRCRMPTRPLLELSAVERHTESSGTLCSVTC